MNEQEIYKQQPSWCTYHEAARPVWGCESLLGGLVISEEYCKNCEMYKHNQQ